MQIEGNPALLAIVGLTPLSEENSATQEIATNIFQQSCAGASDKAYTFTVLQKQEQCLQLLIQKDLKDNKIYQQKYRDIISSQVSVCRKLMNKDPNSYQMATEITPQVITRQIKNLDERYVPFYKAAHLGKIRTLDPAQQALLIKKILLPSCLRNQQNELDLVINYIQEKGWIFKN